MLYKVLGGLKAEKGTIFDPWIYRRSLEPIIITVPWQFKLIHNLSRKYKRHQSFFFVSVLNLTNAEFLALISSEKIAKIHTHGQSISVHFRRISEAGKTFALSYLKTINCGDLYIFQRSNLSWTKVAFYFFHLRERNDIKRKITEASRKHGSNKRTIFDPSVETALRDVFVIGIDYISRASVRLIQCDEYY